MCDFLSHWSLKFYILLRWRKERTSQNNKILWRQILQVSTEHNYYLVFGSPSFIGNSKTFGFCWFIHYLPPSFYFVEAIYSNHTNILNNRYLRPFFLMYKFK